MAEKITPEGRELGQRLGDARRLRTPPLEQAEVAEMLGVSDRTVSRWERGASRASRAQLSQLEAIYGVAAGSLGGTTAHGAVSRGTMAASDPATAYTTGTRPFAEDVIFMAGRIAQLAEIIQHAARQQVERTEQLSARAEATRASETLAHGMAGLRAADRADAAKQQTAAPARRKAQGR